MRLSAPDGRVCADLELVVAVVDGDARTTRPLTERERAALAS